MSERCSCIARLISSTLPRPRECRRHRDDRARPRITCTTSAPALETRREASSALSSACEAPTDVEGYEDRAGALRIPANAQPGTVTGRAGTTVEIACL
jgi:hypothetical protein